MSGILIFCPFGEANLYESTGNQILKIEVQFASQSIICPSKTVTRHNLRQKTFNFFAVATKKQPTYTVKDEQDEIIRGTFYQKELNEVP